MMSRVFKALLFAPVVVFLLCLNASAQAVFPGMTSSSGTTDTPQLEDPSPNDVRELMRLLSDPEMVEWLKQRAEDTGASSSEDADRSVREAVAAAMEGARIRIKGISEAFASLPQGLSDLAGRVNEILPPGFRLRAATYVLIFLFVGAGLEWLFWQYFYPVKLRIEISRHDRLSRRFLAALGRAGLTASAVFVFALGSIGTFLTFDWPPLLEWIIVNLLLGFVVLRAIIALSIFLFSPRVPRLRLVPLNDSYAWQAHRWTIGVAIVWIGGLLIADAPRRMAQATNSGFETAEAIAAIAGIIIALVFILAIWRLTPGVRALENENTATSGRRSAANLIPIIQTALVVLILLAWFAGISEIMGSLIVAALVVPIMHVTRILIDHVFDQSQNPTIDPPAPVFAQEAASEDIVETTASETPTTEPAEVPPVPAETERFDYQRPIVHRVARLFIIICAIVALGMVWGVNIHTLSQSQTTLGRIVGVAIDISAALLIADLIWTWAKTAIDRKMAENSAVENELGPGPEARMLTLLPIFRMTLLIVLLTVVGLTLLSSLGVNIAPLLAGAGVVGIAIGFGAQALVRDVVSGIFFLLDDAFRVGEYIEMENLRGTVEAMSLRSLKVRHHRGAVHTIPFGELKSLTNYSRDWVMMKLEFRVPFDTDLMLVKKIVKRVGKELLEHENYGKHIIETLKSQGVRRMEEFNMVVGVKFMTKPGAQWVIRRDAYQKLRDEFEKNGINFAERNVKVEVISDHPLTDEQKDAAVGAAQPAIEQQLGPEGAAPPPDEP